MCHTEKLQINESACIGCGLCVTLCPAFQFNDRGTVELLDGVVVSNDEIQRIISRTDVLQCITWH